MSDSLMFVIHLIENKPIIALIIFIISFLGAIAPSYILKVNQHVFSVGNMFSAGILLAGGIVHQLADSSETLPDKVDIDFPIAEFLAGLTFLAFFIFEEIIHISFATTTTTNTDINTVTEEEDDERRGQYHIHHDDNDIPSVPPEQQQSQGKNDVEEIPSERTNLIENLADHHSPSHHHPPHHHDGHISQHLHGSLLASIILLLALSVHSILEGLAIGASTEEGQIIAITVAILAHKGFAGYALGSSMVAAGMKRDHYCILVTIFASCTPIGVLLGYIVFGNSPDDTIATAIIQATVAGTFLYVAIVEVAMKEVLTCRQPETCDKRLEVQKLSAFLTGYVCFSALAIWV